MKKTLLCLFTAVAALSAAGKNTLLLNMESREAIAAKNARFHGGAFADGAPIGNSVTNGNRAFVGGGHAALLLAARYPELWTAVSAWCPISDIAAWHKQCQDRALRYAKDIEQICGGDPQIAAFALQEAKKCSPQTCLSNAANKCLIDINTGIHDGHTGSVPVSQALNAFNLLASPEDRISIEDIEYMTRLEKIPEHLVFNGTDPAYGNYKVLMRRISGMVRITLFEGSHDILPGAGLAWFANQSRGTKPIWNSGMIFDDGTENTLNK